ncbi:MAG: hypothetical protein J6Y58_05520 [Clostridiales bacterium]|nr:hypothetical protein [Clostridiales bacterium]
MFSEYILSCDLYWDRDETAITETSKKYGRYCFSIASRLGVSENTVSVSIRRLRIKLRDYLRSRGYEL